MKTPNAGRHQNDRDDSDEGAAHENESKGADSAGGRRSRGAHHGNNAGSDVRGTDRGRDIDSAKEGPTGRRPFGLAGSSDSAGASPSRADSSSAHESPKASDEHETGSANHNLPTPRNTLRRRKRPVHGVFPQPDQPTIVSVTVCTKGRRRWLADESVHRLLIDIWKAAILWRVGRYVIMPDHIHLFAGESGEVPLDNWVRYWKSQFTKQHGHKEHRWQTDHWDRRVRSKLEYEDAWNYIYWNPVRAKLVAEPDHWPYSGAIHELPWD